LGVEGPGRGVFTFWEMFIYLLVMEVFMGLVDYVVQEWKTLDGGTNFMIALRAKKATRSEKYNYMPIPKDMKKENLLELYVGTAVFWAYLIRHPVKVIKGLKCATEESIDPSDFY
jgi:hypothetical protein